MRTNQKLSDAHAHLCFYSLVRYGCGQSLTTNALKHLVDQLEKRILQIYQSKIALKHL